MNTVIYHRLPAGPAPKALTAQAPTPSLYEHFLAFAAKNNPRGFERDQASIESPLLIAFLELVQRYRTIRVNRLRQVARAIHTKLAPLGVDYSWCRDLAALMAGYESWEQLEETGRADQLRCWIRPFPVVVDRMLPEDQQVDVQPILIEVRERHKKVQAARKEARKRPLDSLFLQVREHGLAELLAADQSPEFRLWLRQVAMLQRQTHATGSQCEQARTSLGKLWSEKMRFTGVSNLLAVLLGYPSMTPMAEARDEDKRIPVQTPESLKIPI